MNSILGASTGSASSFLDMIKTFMMGQIELGGTLITMWWIIAAAAGLMLLLIILCACLAKKRVSKSELNNADEIVKDIQNKYAMSTKPIAPIPPAFAVVDKVPDPESCSTPIEKQIDELLAKPADTTSSVDTTAIDAQELETVQEPTENAEQPATDETPTEEEVDISTLTPADAVENDVNFGDLDVDDILNDTLQDDQTPQAEDTKVCPRCGAKVTEQICPYCGADIDTPIKEVADEQAANDTEKAVQETPAQDEHTKVCPRCGAKTAEQVCPYCGADVDTPVEDIEPVADIQTVPANHLEEAVEEVADEPTPVEEPTEEAVVEPTPVEETPVEETPAEPTPVEPTLAETEIEEIAEDPQAEDLTETPAEEPMPVEENSVTNDDAEPVDEPVENPTEDNNVTPVVAAAVAGAVVGAIASNAVDEEPTPTEQDVEEPTTPMASIQAEIAPAVPVINPSTKKKVVQKKANLVKAPTSRPAGARAPKKASAVKAETKTTPIKDTPANTISNFAPITVVNNDTSITVIKLFGDKPEPKFGKYVVEQIEGELVRPYRFVIKNKDNVTIFQSEGYKIRPRARQIETFRKAVNTGSIIYGNDKDGYYSFKLMTADNKIFGSGMPSRTLEGAKRDGDALKSFSDNINFIEDPQA